MSTGASQRGESTPGGVVGGLHGLAQDLAVEGAARTAGEGSRQAEAERLRAEIAEREAQLAALAAAALTAEAEVGARQRSEAERVAAAIQRGLIRDMAVMVGRDSALRAGADLDHLPVSVALLVCVCAGDDGEAGVVQVVLPVPATITDAWSSPKAGLCAGAARRVVGALTRGLQGTGDQVGAPSFGSVHGAFSVALRVRPDRPTERVLSVVINALDGLRCAVAMAGPVTPGLDIVVMDHLLPSTVGGTPSRRPHEPG